MKVSTDQTSEECMMLQPRIGRDEVKYIIHVCPWRGLRKGQREAPVATLCLPTIKS